MKIAVLGAGAIGCYVASRFASTPDNTVHLLARSNFEDLQTQGLYISEASNDATSHVPANMLHLSHQIDELPKADFIIICVNSNQTSELAGHLKNLCYPHTKVITLQNGLDFEKEISPHLSDNTPLYSGTCWIRVSSLTPNHKRHDFGKMIKLGRYLAPHKTHSITQEDEEIQQVFSKADLAVDLVDNIRGVQLTKLALNVPFFTLAAVTGKSFSEILADPELDRYRIQLQNEIEQTSKLIGSPVDTAYIESVTNNLRKMTATPPASRDEFSQRMKKELPQNTGMLIKFMQENHVSLIYIEKLYQEALKSNS